MLFCNATLQDGNNCVDSQIDQASLVLLDDALENEFGLSEIGSEADQEDDGFESVETTQTVVLSRYNAVVGPGSLLSSFNEKLLAFPVLDKLPDISQLSAGCHIFLLDKALFKNPSDITRDHLSPWTGKIEGTEKRVSTKSTKQCVIQNSSGFEKCLDSCNKHYTFKTIKNKHVQLNIWRMILYVVCHKNYLVSNVLFVYDSMDDINYVPKKRRILPSEAESLRSLLEYRTTSSVKRIIADSDISKEQVVNMARRVPTHIKSGSGRRTPSDINQLLNRYARINTKNEIMLQPWFERTEKGVQFRQIVGYVTAFRHFTESLPYIDEFMEHKQFVESIQKATKTDAEKMFGDVLTSGQLSASGSLPNIGAMLSIDTTFSLASGEYTTIALGISDVFRSKSSKKNASIILAVMIHSTKSSINHEEFASFLNCKFKEFGPNKVIPGVIHDGEKSFQSYTLGSFLKNSILLRCDQHRRENIKALFNNTERLMCENVLKRLFGKKENTQQGTVLNKGYLNYFDESEYKHKMKLLCQYTPESFKKWCKSNMDDLFSTNSLLSKFKAGQTQQFLTTNLLECRNALLKQYVPRPLPAHKLLEVFANLHDQEVKSRFHAILEKSKDLETHNTYSESAWMKLTNIERLSILRTYGLHGFYYNPKFFDYPSWLLEGDGSTNIEAVLESTASFHVLEVVGDSTTFVVADENNNSVIVKVGEEFVMDCFHGYCLKHKDAGFFLCSHRLVVFGSLSQEVCTNIVDQLSAKRESRTCADIQRQQLAPGDGSKNPKRRGGGYSKNNESRNYDALGTSFASTNGNDTLGLSKLSDTDDEY